MSRTGDLARRRRPCLVRCAAVLPLLAGLAGCDGSRDPYAPAARDSLGIEIVEHPSPPAEGGA
jgi:hypothetical protein